MSDRTLEATLDAVWTQIARGVTDRTAPARQLVLATVGERGAEARMVVLRGADRAARTLEIHTDAASAKVAELKANPKATLLIWDQLTDLQIRIRVNVTVKIGEPYSWARVPTAARDVYGGAPTPGQPIDDPTDFSPSPDVTRFAVLTCQIREIETLELASPHRRARFRDATQGWIAP